MGCSMLYGQFIDHDLTLTDTNNTEPFPIVIPDDDPALYVLLFIYYLLISYLS